MNSKKIKIVGNLITLVSIVFLTLKFVQLDIDYSNINDKRFAIKIIILGIIYGTAALICAPWAWSLVIRLLCKCKVDTITVQMTMARSNLMKYIPGNIFQYVGRNGIAVECNLSHQLIAMSTVVDTLLNIIGAFFLSLICCASGLNVGLIQLQQYIGFKQIGIMICLLLCLIFIVCKKQKNNVKKVIRILLSPQGAVVYLQSTILYLILSFIHGALYWYVLTKIVCFDKSAGDFFIIIACYQISWICGFLVPGAPGGIGIRESIITLLLGTAINSADVLLAIVIYRIINIVGDSLYYLEALVIYKIKRSGTTIPHYYS